MCPDIEAYAPLMQGGFGLDEVVDGGHPAHGLWVRLADRALTQTNPLLATVDRLLDLADGRVTASQVLDLAAWAPVRRRFGFDDDELERLAGWVAESGARWGLDAAHRGRVRVGRLPAEHLAGRAGPGPARGGDGRRGQQPARRPPCRSTMSGARTSTWPAGSPSCSARLTAALDALTGTTRSATGSTALVDSVDSLTSVSATNGWQSAELRRELGAVERQRRPRPVRTISAEQVRHPGAARGPVGRAPDPGELPHRHAHRVHHGADAIGAAPGGLPARARRRCVPADRAARTATTSWPGTPPWANVTLAPRTGN